jgi:anti-sigma factor RsiW
MSKPDQSRLIESKARALKAIALADVLQAVGASADVAAEMREESWRLAAIAAHVKYPSETTKELVIEILRKRGIWE